MKILHCIPNMCGGGAERQLTYLAKELTSKGLKIYVVLGGNGQNTQRLVQSGATIHRLSAKNNHDPRLLYQLVKIINYVKPDIIQTWLTQMDILGVIAARICRIPVILTERSSAEMYPFSIKNAIRKYCGRFTSAIISNAACGNEYWQQHVPGRTAIYIVRNGIPFNEIDSAVKFCPTEVAASFDFTIVAVGRLISSKNFNLLIEALPIVRKHFNAALLFCGAGSEKSKYQQLARTLGVDNAFYQLGFREDVWNILKSSALLISPSSYEGHPNAVLEAMACNCPVVVSDIPAHREFLDERSALFIKSMKAQSIAEAIITVLSNAKESRERVRRARQIADQYAVSRLGEEFLKIYLTVISKESGRH